MLVLSRRPEEAICIGDNIEVMVVQVRGDRVRIGIEAPRHIQVDRKEIYLRKRTAESSAELALPMAFDPA
jgi:carbon storage regulator